MWIWVILLLVVAVLAYVRLAPFDASSMHQPVEGSTDEDKDGSCLRVIPAKDGILRQLDTAMKSLPRTSVVAGAVEEGRVTYVTRSKWIGFPDYTTIEESEGTVSMLARLRFGKSDFGVNRTRLEKVLQTAKSA